RVLSLADQFGEGWLIPAEISSLAEEGVEHVVCLQPFGCIANHIVAKGVEKRIRDLYPRLNLLYLDMDAGAGEANLHNRLHFIVQGAKEAVVQTPDRQGVKMTLPADHKAPAPHAPVSTADILSA
ncbi:MAG TPA: hypothetical protein VLT13_15115, partial [Bacteroidota bacterium]|nr:hypothetical protein [Bacteroidota bacterium]